MARYVRTDDFLVEPEPLPDQLFDLRWDLLDELDEAARELDRQRICPGR